MIDIKRQVQKDGLRKDHLESYTVYQDAVGDVFLFVSGKRVYFFEDGSACLMETSDDDGPFAVFGGSVTLRN